ncbi:putative ribosomal protein P1/P2 [Helianthus annuus]|nr:putative ribosomal protein P1/P2 [Helianthus annuus]
MSIGELASTYACLILSDDGIPITVIRLILIEIDGSDEVTVKLDSVLYILCICICIGWCSAEKIATILKAANVECESYWPSLFAKLAEKKNIEDLIVSVGAGGGGGAPAVAAAPAAGGAAAAAPAAEEKKEEEPKEDTDDDMGFSLFD